MINVLEHVNNGIALLRNLYNTLKPGGILIFNDRWWDSEGKPGSVRATMDQDVLYHPVSALSGKGVGVGVGVGVGT